MQASSVEATAVSQSKLRAPHERIGTGPTNALNNIRTAKSLRFGESCSHLVHGAQIFRIGGVHPTCHIAACAIIAAYFPSVAASCEWVCLPLLIAESRSSGSDRDRPSYASPSTALYHLLVRDMTSGILCLAGDVELLWLLSQTSGIEAD
jgi:hypothetical protein